MRRILYLHGFASGPGSKKGRYFAERLPGLEIPDLASGGFEHLTITGQLAVLDRAARDDHVALIGSSLGGYLAALHAARSPRVERLVLLAPAFGFARRWAETADDWKRAGYREFYHYGQQRLARVGYQLLEDALQYQDFPDFPQPALVFHGRLDDTVPVEYSIRYAQNRPNVELSVLDSDHELMDVLDEIWKQSGGFLTRSDL